MIRYTLSCDRAHRFESWFPSAAGYDALAAAGKLACPVCGSVAISKTLMAPSVQIKPAPKSDAAIADGPRPLTTGQPTQLENAIMALRRQVEENSDYVGPDFAKEARAMHDGEAPARAIYGEAGPEDARKLMEDGVPVMPLPFIPVRKTN
jgi:hypothetical protein